MKRAVRKKLRTPTTPFNRHKTLLTLTFSGITIFGVILVAIGGRSLDVAVDAERALGGWRLQTTSSLVIIAGVFCFFTGFISSYALQYGKKRVLYVVGMLIIPLLLGLVVISISSILAVKKVKKEASEKIIEAFNKVNFSFENQQAIFNLQEQKKCCGLNGPSFYNFFIINISSSSHVVPLSCCTPDSRLNYEPGTEETDGNATPIWTESYCSPDDAFQLGCAEVVAASMKESYTYMGGLTMMCAIFLFLVLLADYFLIRDAERAF